MVQNRIKKIEEILEKKFGIENKSQYEYILKKNEKYGYFYYENEKIKIEKEME